MKDALAAALRWALWLSPLVLPITFQGVGSVPALVFVLVGLIFCSPFRSSIRIISGRPLVALAWGCGLGLFLFLFTTFVFEPVLQSLFGVTPDVSKLPNVRESFSALLGILGLAIIWGGVVEELLFRGVIVGWGRHLFGVRSLPSLLVISALIFGAIHAYQGPAGIAEMVVVGAILAAFYARAGFNVLPVMTAHAVMDVLGILALRFNYPQSH